MSGDHLSRLKIVGIVKQDAPNVFKDAFTGPDCRLQAYIDNTDFAAENDTFRRNVTSKTFDKDVDIISRESGTIRARAELRGSGNGKMGIASWDPWMESCLALRSAGKSFALDEASSTTLANWRSGVKLTQETSGATAYLVYVDTTNDLVILRTVSGTPNGANDWAGTSQAGSFKVAPNTSAPTDYGQVYYPETVSEIFAQGKLTLDTNPIDGNGDTMTIGDVTYTFKDTPTAANDITIGATVTETQENLVKALVCNGTEGVEYGVGTKPNPKAYVEPFNFSQGTLTLAVNPTADTDTMVVGDITYSFVSGLTTAANEILVGATLGETQVNVVHALNGTGQAGLNYSVGTVKNPKVGIADFDGTTNKAVLTARQRGAIGDSYATTETFTSGSNEFDGTTLGTTTTGTEALVTALISGAVGNNYPTIETFTAATNQFDGVTLGGVTQGDSRHYSVAEFKPFGQSGKATRHTIKNAVGDCVVSADNIGQPWFFDFTIRGVQNDEDRVDEPTGIVHETIRPKRFAGINYYIEGAAAATKAQCKVNQFRFAFGNQIEPDEFATTEDDTGFNRFDIVDRDPSGEHNPRLLEPQVKSWYRDYKDQKTGYMVATNGADTEGEIVEIYLPKIQYTSYGHDDVGGKYAARLPFGVKSHDTDVGRNSFFVISR